MIQENVPEIKEDLNVHTERHTMWTSVQTQTLKLKYIIALLLDFKDKVLWHSRQKDQAPYKIRLSAFLPTRINTCPKLSQQSNSFYVNKKKKKRAWDGCTE